MSDRPPFSREPRTGRDFDRKDNNSRDDRPRSDRPRSDDRPRDDRPRSDRPRSDDRPRDDRPRSDRPRSDDRPRDDRPRSDRPRSDDRPRDDRPRSDRPRSDDRPRDDRPRSDRPRSDDRFKRDDRPRTDRSRDDRPRSDDRFKRDDRPRTDRSRDDRPRSDDRFKRDDRPRDDRPRSDRPRSDDRFKRDDRPRTDRPRDDRPRSDDRFKRDDRPRDDRPRSDDRFKRDDRPRDDRPRSDRPREDRGDRKPGRRFEGDRRDFSRDDNKKDFRRDKDRGDFRNDSRGDAPRMGVMDLIREADVELVRMLVRRTRLREKLSESHAGAKERDLRTAWEEAATRVSRDPRLLRDMFTLLQQIDVNAPDADSPQAFTLSPASQPVRINLPVPASTRQTRLRMALAAGTGAPLVLGNALLNSEVVTCLKMFNCVGAALRWEENPDRVECSATAPICGSTLPVLDKVIYVGDDPFNFYLMLFQLITRPSRVKFMGESTMRFLDTSPLRRFLPVLGARLTSVVPGEDGLPARMECSAILPDRITVPTDIPADAVVALLAATPFWTGSVCVDLEARPDVSLGEVTHLLRACGCSVEDNGVTLTVTPPDRLTMPEGNDMDLLAAFPLLAFAGCTGGESTVHGHWPKEHPCGSAALALLRSIATVNVTDNTVTATALIHDEEGEEGIESETGEGTAPDADLTAVPLELLGPALALYLLRCRNIDSPALPLLPAGHDTELVDGFLAVLGYVCGEDSLIKAEPVYVPWAAPSAWWGMGLVLASFFVPKLRMANPAVITTLLPQFWGMFNALPEPSVERPKPEEDAPIPEEPRRRRVLAEYMPESEMPPAIEYEDDDY